jgi:hypothetical protein
MIVCYVLVRLFPTDWGLDNFSRREKVGDDSAANGSSPVEVTGFVM